MNKEHRDKIPAISRRGACLIIVGNGFYIKELVRVAYVVISAILTGRFSRQLLVAATAKANRVENVVSILNG